MKEKERWTGSWSFELGCDGDSTKYRVDGLRRYRRPSVWSPPKGKRGVLLGVIADWIHALRRFLYA